MLGEAAKSNDVRLLLKRWCKHNILFWINAFVWTLDTRKTKSGTMAPFITFQCQDEAIKKTQKAIFPKGNSVQHTVINEKSRDMGLTWIDALILLHATLFSDDVCEFFCMSYKEEVVDGEYASVMGKMRFAIRYMPSWLLPQLSMPQLLIKNIDTGSSIKGSSTTSDAGVSGRYTAMFFDEFSLVSDAATIWSKTAACADCRIVNGTHRGNGVEFARIAAQGVITDKPVLNRSIIEKIQLPWWKHPWKAKGLYYDENGKRRSPWYDDECVRLGNNRQEIARELDMDPTISGSNVFDPMEINRLVKNYSVDPYVVGSWAEKFVTNPKGTFRLWLNLIGDTPPKGRYGIGVDPSTGAQGKYSTPSCLCVVNLSTGEKVAEMADPAIIPSQLGHRVAEIARWFHNALVVWEGNGGVGASFRKGLMEEAQYTHIYFRQTGADRLSTEVTDKPGWYSDPVSKMALILEYREALSRGRFLNRSEAALKECLNFEYNGNTVAHPLELVKDDPSGAKANHGDQVVADALAWLLCKGEGLTITVGGQPEERDPPVMSPAWIDRLLEEEDDLDGWGP